MDYPSLILISLVTGMITGILTRIPQIRVVMWIVNIGTIITLSSFIIYVPNYFNTPTTEGVYAFIYTVIPFAISTACSAKGEESVSSNRLR